MKQHFDFPKKPLSTKVLINCLKKDKQPYSKNIEIRLFINFLYDYLKLK